MMLSFKKNKWLRPCSAALLLAIFALLAIHSMVFKSFTYDEPYHLEYGAKILNGDPARSNFWHDSKMPFSAFNAMSAKLAANRMNPKFISGMSAWFADRVPEKQIPLHIIYLSGRIVTVAFALLLGIYIYWWSRKLFGASAGLFSLFLFAFSPNILAHSRLVTTDLFAALMVTAATYHFWQFLKYGGWPRAIISAAILGISQLAKYTCIFLFPLFILISLYHYRMPITQCFKRRAWDQKRQILVNFAKYSTAFALISLVIINIGFGFHRTFTPLEEYRLSSRMFKTVQQIPVLKSIPLPIPYEYLEGLDLVKHHERSGKSFGNIYLLGKLREASGGSFKSFKSYYIIAFLFKEPIAIQIIIIWSAWILIRRRDLFAGLYEDIIAFLVIPLLFFATYFSFLFKAQIGFRFILILLPLLYVLCGSVIAAWNRYGTRTKCMVGCLLAYLAVSTISYHPHYLSYFNEFVWDRKKSYKILSDSNICWGQNRFYLYNYMKANPGAHLDPRHRVEGKSIIQVNCLTGVSCPESAYRWLRENYQPTGHIGYSFLIYDNLTK